MSVPNKKLCCEMLICHREGKHLLVNEEKENTGLLAEKKNRNKGWSKYAGALCHTKNSLNIATNM